MSDGQLALSILRKFIASSDAVEGYVSCQTFGSFDDDEDRPITARIIIIDATIDANEDELAFMERLRRPT